MKVANTIIELRNTVKTWRMTGNRIAFVPTMGNLHDGHLKLVEEAKKSADKVVVSIFVNPTQFGPNEDFAAYPRTEAEDSQKLLAVGIDLLFMPSVDQMYGEREKTIVSVKNLSTMYCGAFRPVHFDGVATVVCKLFNMVQADVAFFGEKDYQQLVIIRTMANDLNIPIEILAVPTVRENSGLALSSRNSYLSLEELQIAPTLYLALCAAKDAIAERNKPYETIIQESLSKLQAVGFVPDYFVICRTADLQKAETTDSDLVILAAARLGKTRLIDNLRVSLAR